MTALTLTRGGFGKREQWKRDMGAAAPGSQITVLNGHSRGGGLRDPEGTFSVKWIPAGRTIYRTGGVSHRLDAGKALILNSQQAYELEFVDGPYSQTLCVFFSDDLVTEAWTSLVAPEASIGGWAAHAPQFPDLVFAPGAEIGPALADLHAGFDADDPVGRIDEGELLLLLGRLVRTAEGHRLSAAGIPALKPTTRRDLLARLQRARDLIDDRLTAPPDLDELAREAALSKFHFLRLFKSAFGVTPTAYAGQRRIERAMALLRATDHSLDRIAEDVGYETAASLVRAFRRETGATPGAWRSEIRNFG